VQRLANEPRRFRNLETGSDQQPLAWRPIITKQPLQAPKLPQALPGEQEPEFSPVVQLPRRILQGITAWALLLPGCRAGLFQ